MIKEYIDETIKSLKSDYPSKSELYRKMTSDIDVSYHLYLAKKIAAIPNKNLCDKYSIPNYFLILLFSFSAIFLLVSQEYFGSIPIPALIEHFTPIYLGVGMCVLLAYGFYKNNVIAYSIYFYISILTLIKNSIDVINHSLQTELTVIITNIFLMLFVIWLKRELYPEYGIFGNVLLDKTDKVKFSN